MVSRSTLSTQRNRVARLRSTNQSDSEELAQIGKQYVTRKRFDVADGEWLNDEVINFMMETHQREGVCVQLVLYSMLMQNDVYDYKQFADGQRDERSTCLNLRNYSFDQFARPLVVGRNQHVSEGIYLSGLDESTRSFGFGRD